MTFSYSDNFLWATSSIRFNHGCEIKPAPEFGSGSGRIPGCKITPAPIGSKTRWSLETRTQITFPTLHSTAISTTKPGATKVLAQQGTRH
jgi:hypothetical protein